MSNEIVAALQQNRLRLYFQPIYNLTDKTIVGYEVFARFVKTNGELIMASEWLSIAAEQHLVLKIDKWVIDNFFTWLHTTGRKGLFFVNLSIKSINTDFIRFLSNKVKNLQIDTSQICFEVSEDEVIENLNVFLKLSHNFRLMGYRFAIDDFKKFEVDLRRFYLNIDYIKIDGKLVKGMTEELASISDISFLAFTTQTTKIQLIAKSVEKKEQIALLLAAGIKLGQGYILRVPEPLEFWL